ncbi:hypothetical protein Plhal304r1_c015g0056421 [Plasmopara halstedii]
MSPRKYWCKCRWCGRHDANSCVRHWPSEDHHSGGRHRGEFFLSDVLYVEGASHGLFSMHLAITKQKFKISYDRAASTKFGCFRRSVQRMLRDAQVYRV